MVDHLLFKHIFKARTSLHLQACFQRNILTSSSRFRRASAQHRLDSKVLRCGRLRAEDRRIENFGFWHDRLVILKQVFDEAEPSTLYQWWFDRRKRVRWYTFWVAVLVLFLTILFKIIQCVEGGLQMYKAFDP
jgi:hypothetical protein